MSISLPPRPPELDDLSPLDQEALIREARRRARRRRLRNLTGMLAGMLGAVWLYSLLGGGGPQGGSAFLSDSSSPGAAPVRAALPEELSFNANDGVVLVHRDGTREDLAPAVIRQQPNGGWHVLRYVGVQWSPDGSRLLALRYQSPRRPGISLVVMDANGKVGQAIARRSMDGRWSPDGTRIAFIRSEPGAGRALYVASSNGRKVTRVATRLQTRFDPVFSWSPNGTELAYAGEGSSGLFVVKASGDDISRPVPLAAGGGGPHRQVGRVAWSPGGSLIAFNGCCRLFVAHPDGTSLRQVADGYDFAWSPDGELLAVIGPAGGSTWGHVSIVRSNGEAFRTIATCKCELRGPGFSQSVSWSSDGSRLAYVSGRGNTVSTIRLDGSGATVVATQAARGPSGNWYPAAPLWRPSRVR